MWGRFTYKLTWEELVRLYRLIDQPAGEAQARYNVCPTDPVDTIVECDGKCEFVTMRWGDGSGAAAVVEAPCFIVRDTTGKRSPSCIARTSPDAGQRPICSPAMGQGGLR
jgi:putative SOS response-associated peptidase YedK